MVKQNQKIFTVLIFLFYFCWLFSPTVVFAADTQTYSEQTFMLNVPIGTLTSFKISQSSNNILGTYIQAWYGFLIGTVGIIAAVMIMYGGIKFLSSRGDNTQISNARETIISAITGLVLAFGSYTILSIVSPNLLTIHVPALPRIQDTSGINMGDQNIPSDAIGKYPQGGVTGGAPGRVGGASAANIVQSGGAAPGSRTNGTAPIIGDKNGINDFDPKNWDTLNKMSTIAGVGSEGTYPGHDPTMQKAVDLMLETLASADPAQGDQIATYLMLHADELNIHYVMWNHSIWNPHTDTPSGQPDPIAPPDQWRSVSDRGTPTQNHEDHVHVSFN